MKSSRPLVSLPHQKSFSYLPHLCSASASPASSSSPTTATEKTLHRRERMAAGLLFIEEDMAIDEGLGYPKAYAKLCRDRSVSPYSHGPPFTFTPYALQHNEGLRAAEFDEMFPITDPKAKPTTKPKIFVSLLWKQLNHLGNAGFDPAVFRVDPYGNVLYYHADSASPLAWDIDHWFPCSRGGLTVPSNLRILQWQVCKKKHNNLEFLIPWWDLQVGISINQFLSIFASSNSDFRRRAFCLLFSEGENEEVNGSQSVESHAFPQHFMESKEKLGLAPAAIVVCRREPCDSSSSPLKSLDINRRPRSNSPIVASRKSKTSMSKENENPNMVTNPYQAIVLARDSLRQREETSKMQEQVQKLEDEVNQLKQKAEEEKLAIQELELVLIKRRRRAEKCRRLAETQSSYRTMLEKMIRDAMHQSVVYKEQLRLNQAANNALMARLEAQRAICDSSEKELYGKFKQRDELEKQIRSEGGKHARKRSRIDYLGFEGRDDKTVLCLPRIKSMASPLHKELRVFLAEEQKASEEGLSLNEEQKQEEIVNNIREGEPEECNRDDENAIEDKLPALKRAEERPEIYRIQFPVPRELEGEEVEEEEDEESRRQRGKGNVEKWLQMLLENGTPEGNDTNPQNVDDNESSKTDEIIKKLNLKYPPPDLEGSIRIREPQFEKKDGTKIEEERVHIEDRIKPIKTPPYKLLKEKSRANEVEIVSLGEESRKSFGGGQERKERRIEKEKGLVRSESARTFRRIPSSPSLILGMKKGVDCIRKKPLVIGDDDGDDEDRAAGNSFIKSSIKTIKKAVRI